MKRTLRSWLLAGALGLIVVAAHSAPASEMGQAAADEVSQSSYTDILVNWLYTHPGDNRGFGPEHDLAQDNIVFLFESYGLSVALEPFTYSSSTYYNVVATKLGTVFPNQEYVVGAHYDSVDNPGADDDASGVALILEVARVVSQYDSEYTIRFVAFDREEQGLYGSNAYVDDHIGDDILGMIQADMVAYDPSTNHALIYGSANSLPIKTDLGAAITLYSDGLTYTDDGWNGQSDHAPFDAAGYQACLLIEGEVWNNPYYHTQDDHVQNLGYINYRYATKMTRSVVGFLVDHANVMVPVDALVFTFPDGHPEFVAPDGGTHLRVEVTALGNAVPDPGTGMLHYDIGNGWEVVPMEEITPNVYDAVFPAADCGVDVLYYVSAQAVGGDPFTSPWGAPASSYSALAAYGIAVLLEDNFETNQGWTVENLGATSGDWQRGVPVDDPGWAYDPTSDSDGSGQCYLTQNQIGNTDVDDGAVRLNSPVLDLSQGGIIGYDYYLYLSNTDGGVDRQL
ncbi:MAG: M28 family metallopeptidase, partial [Planctomycetota bacterium]